MKINDIITYRGRDYEVCRVTKQTKQYPGRKIIIRRAYLAPHGWSGENRIGLLRDNKVYALEKKPLWGYDRDYYCTWHRGGAHSTWQRV